MFCLTAKFLGNHLLSYGQHLTLSFTAESRELLPKIVTMVLEGSGLSVSADVFSTQYEESETSQIPHNIFTLRYVSKSLYNVCVHWAPYIKQDMN